MSKSMRSKAVFSRAAVGAEHQASAAPVSSETGRIHAPATSQSDPHYLSALENSPIWEGRIIAAAILDAVLNEKDEEAQYQFSARALAKLLRVDEKQIRQWRTAEKPMPVSVLVKLPWPIVLQCMRKIAATHGKTIGVVKPREGAS